MLKQKPPYSAFARVYDRTMHDIPYHHWAYYIYQVFEDYNINSDDWVLDVGAGTGIIADKLAPYYNLVAMDISSNMLGYARQNKSIKCIQADMRKLPFKEGSLSASYSTHDCLNYLTSEEMVSEHFNEIYRTLKKGGLYIFDYSTEYNVTRNFNNKVFSERHGNYHMRWANTYDNSRRVVTSIIDVTERLPYWFGFLIFWKRKKFREIHIQKVFSEETLEKLCTGAGFEILNKDYDYNDNENISAEHAHILVYVLKKIK